MNPSERPKRLDEDDDGDPGGRPPVPPPGEGRGMLDDAGERVYEDDRAGCEDVGGVPAGLAFDEDDADADDWRWRGRMSTAVGGDMVVSGTVQRLQLGASLSSSRRGETVTRCRCMRGGRSVRGDRNGGARLLADAGGQHGSLDCLHVVNERTSGCCWRASGWMARVTGERSQRRRRDGGQQLLCEGWPSAV